MAQTKRLARLLVFLAGFLASVSGFTFDMRAAPIDAPTMDSHICFQQHEIKDTLVILEISLEGNAKQIIDVEVSPDRRAEAYQESSH